MTMQLPFLSSLPNRTDGTVCLRLNPLVKWVRFGNERQCVQVRSLDGEHVTFNRYAEDIEYVLSRLRTGIIFNDVEEKTFSTVALALLSQLWQRSLLIVDGDIDASDWAACLFEFKRQREDNDFHHGRVPSALAHFDIIGDGWIQQRVEGISAKLPSRHDGAGHSASPTKTLTIVCTDAFDLQFCRDINTRVVRTGGCVTFFVLSSGQLHCGPFVIPGQSACYECYYQRFLANLLCRDEFEAFVAMETSRRQARDWSASHVAAGVVEFLIYRHLVGIVTNIFDVAEPGYIETFDLLNMEKQRLAILKLPLCAVCGRHAGKPMRSVRNLV
jgi:bacteriocin biosynthesis cyclodehydratase domain-containing protein